MRILGIDLGSWSIKAVEIETNWRKTQVLDLYEVPLPLQLTDLKTHYQEAIQELLSGLPSHPDKIVTSLSADKIAVRFLRIPIAGRKKVEQMFRFELEDSVPFKLDESIIEHRVAPDGKGSLVVCAVAPKHLLSQQIDWFQSMGMDPDWLCFDGMGAINSYLGAFPKSKKSSDASRVLLDLGHTKSHLTIFEGENPCVFRTFPWGSFQITEIIANNWGQALEDAQNLKHTKLDLTQADFGGVGEDTSEAILAVLKSLVVDLSHTLSAYRNSSKKEVQSIALIGGGAQLKGLPEFLGTAVGCETTLLSLADHFDFPLEVKNKATGGFFEVFGRAQVFSRKAPFLFNFRKGSFSKSLTLNEVGSLFKNIHFVKAVSLCAVLAGILLGHVTFSLFLAKQQAKSSSELLAKILQDTFRTTPQKVRDHLVQNPSELRKFVDQKVNEVNERLKVVSKKEVEMGTLMKKVSSSFPPTVKVDVHELDLDSSALVIKGILYEGDLGQVIRLLQESSFFKELSIKNESGKFEIRGQVVREG